MDTDRHENLYVTSQGTSAVNVYAPGTYTASKILNEGNQQAPASVAVCPDEPYTCRTPMPTTATQR